MLSSERAHGELRPVGIYLFIYFQDKMADGVRWFSQICRLPSIQMRRRYAVYKIHDDKGVWKLLLGRGGGRGIKLAPQKNPHKVLCVSITLKSQLLICDDDNNKKGQQSIINCEQGSKLEALFLPERWLLIYEWRALQSSPWPLGHSAKILHPKFSALVLR